MSDFAANLPRATPETQAEPQAHAGGTGALNDYSRSAQRSLARETERKAGPPYDDPSPEADAAELGRQSDAPAAHGSPKTPER
jgi:hypothetical protein